MKRWMLLLILAIPIVVLAGGNEYVLPLSNISTSATPSTFTSPIFRGFLHSIAFDIGRTSGGTVDVVIVTATNVGNAVYDTLFDNSSITVDATYYPRVTTHTYTGAQNSPTNIAEFFIPGKAVKITATANTTNVDLKTFIRTEDE